MSKRMQYIVYLMGFVMLVTMDSLSASYKSPSPWQDTNVARLRIKQEEKLRKPFIHKHLSPIEKSKILTDVTRERQDRERRAASGSG